MENQNLVNAARDLAQKLFAGKVRRETGKSVFEAHLKPVADLVAAESYWVNPVAIAAAYLHDSLEDVGIHTLPLLEGVSPEVAQIVLHLTEKGEKSDWRGRKESYLEHVPLMTWWELLISVCDKERGSHDFATEWAKGQFGNRPQEVLEFFHKLVAAYDKRLDQLAAEGDEPFIQQGRSLYKNIEGLIHDIVVNTDSMRIYYKHE